MTQDKDRKHGIRRRANDCGLGYCQMLHRVGATPKGWDALLGDLKRVVEEHLERATEPPEDLAGLATRLATDLGRLNVAWAHRIRPGEAYPYDFARHVAEMVCDYLSDADVSHGEIYDLAVGVVEDVAARIVPEESRTFGMLCAGAVDDHLCPPCDADFEYIDAEFHG